MTIIGIGTDIVEIRRVEAIVSRTGDQFARRILSKTEWIQYQQHNQKVRFLAKRFAIKEAVSKAFGTGISVGLAFVQLEVFNDTLGKPLLRLFEQAEEMANKLGVTGMHITLADERHYAYATVIFER